MLAPLADTTHSSVIDATGIDGPLRILAGPGTGKTAALVSLYCDLVGQGLAARSEILVLTFSTTAAEEISRRISDRLQVSYGESWISTFHGFCNRLLRDLEPDPRTTLMSGFGEWVAMRKVLDEMDPADLGPLGPVRKSDAFARDGLAFVSLLKQNLIYPGRLSLLAETSGSPRMQALARLYRVYQARLDAGQLIDFRDLVARVIGRLESDSSEQARLQSRFKWILVDEFQDVDPAQFELIRLLAPPERRPNLVVVGDPDQSIYGFRGTLPGLLQNEFPRVYAAMTVNLDHSHRCPSPVLDKAQALLHVTDPDRKARTLTGRASEIPVRVLHQGDPLDEAFTVAREIRRLTLESGGSRRAGDFAILLRTTISQAAPFQEALRALDIPHRVRGGGATAQNSVVRFLLSYLRALGADDEGGLEKVLASSLCGLPPRALSRIRARARERDRTPIKLIHRLMYQLAEAEPERFRLPWGNGGETRVPRPETDDERVSSRPEAPWEGLTSDELAELHAAVSAFYALRLKSRRLPLTALAHSILIESGAARRLLELDPGSPERIAGTQNLQVTMTAFEELETIFEALTGDRPGLEAVQSQLESIVLGAIDEHEAQPSDRSTVQIMTIHQAKGLEFDVVFLAGFAHRWLPLRGRPHPLLEAGDQAWLQSSLTGFRPSWPAEGEGHIREEARLAYVGMTRARDLLYLSFADTYGQAAGPSPFLEMMEVAVPDLPDVQSGGSEVLTRSMAEIHLAGLRAEITPAQADRLTALGVDTSFVLDPASGQPFLPHHGSHPEGVDPHHFSPTQITDYLRCPRLYWYNHHPGISPPGSRPEMRRGGFIHKVLEDFHSREEEWRQLHPPEQRAWLEEALASQLEGYLTKAEGVLDRKREELEIRRILDNYMSFATSYQKIPRMGTMAVEKRFVLDVDGAEIHGVIDRINRVSRENECEVVDYKTGGGLFLGRAYDAYFGEHMYDVQLIVYYLACLYGNDAQTSEPLALKPRFLSLWYPKDKVWGSIRQALFTVGTPLGLTQGRERVLDSEDLERARGRLTGAIAGIRGGDFQPAPKDVTGTCLSFTGCPHESICPFSRKRPD
jgi:superfamily I DNA/RNA helicase